jgi:F0F1-type ATP synthase assembly protein I
MSSERKPGGPRRREELFPGLGGAYRDLGPYLTLGIQLAATVVVFFLVGWWLDTRYETSPTFELIGVFLGSVGGMIKFLKSVAALIKKDKSQ